VRQRQVAETDGLRTHVIAWFEAIPSELLEFLESLPIEVTGYESLRAMQGRPLVAHAINERIATFTSRQDRPDFHSLADRTGRSD
jgi:hypothetical protein